MIRIERAPVGTPVSSACVLLCVYQACEERTLSVHEAPIAAAQLKRVMRPAYPILLLANARALRRRALSNTTAFDRVRELRLDGRIRAFDRGTWRGAREARPYLQKLSCRTAGKRSNTAQVLSSYNDVHRLIVPPLNPAAAVLQSDFNRTVFLDCDTFVVRPSLVDHMLSRVLAVADVAMPIDPGREGHLSVGSPPWAAPSYSGPPPLCSALTAYVSTPAVQALWLGAAWRLLSGAHPEVRQGDQEMVWFEWTQAAHSLRVLPLPEEYLCPLESRQRAAPVADDARPHVWRTSWRRGVYRCRAVHGHGYAAAYAALDSRQPR